MYPSVNNRIHDETRQRHAKSRTDTHRTLYFSAIFHTHSPFCVQTHSRAFKYNLTHIARALEHTNICQNAIANIERARKSSTVCGCFYFIRARRLCGFCQSCALCVFFSFHFNRRCVFVTKETVVFFSLVFSLVFRFSVVAIRHTIILKRRNAALIMIPLTMTTLFCRLQQSYCSRDIHFQRLKCVARLFRESY